MACAINRGSIRAFEERIDVVLIAPLSNVLANLRVVRGSLLQRKRKDQLTINDRISRIYTETEEMIEGYVT